MFRSLAPRLAVAIGLVWAGGAQAQTVRLVHTDRGADVVDARLGEVISVDVVVDLGGLEASALAVFVSVPEGPLRVVDAVPGADGTQPFTVGPLFEGAALVANLALAPGRLPELFAGFTLLDFAAAVRPGDSARRGSGVVARFRLRCVREADAVAVRVDQNPVRQSLLLRDDRGTEVPFRVTGDLRVSIRGLRLADIPDVVLLPGERDSTRIGRLDRYVSNHTAPLDSLRWAVSGAEPESLRVEVDPRSRRVRLTPQGDFRGRRRLTFAVSEPAPVVNGEPVPTASDVADVIVNTPPRFTVRRDTVRLPEDGHTYVVSALAEPNPARAYRGRDLDLFVEDPEVPAARRHIAYSYATLSYRPGTDTLRQVRARVAPDSHELLVWSRPDFAGVDSFRVLVADEYTVGPSLGQDVLRVLVVVSEVPDAPRFVFAEPTLVLPVDTRRPVALSDFVSDPDTPLGRLTLTWTADLGGTFGVTLEGDSLRFRAPGFPAQGLFIFTVTDPDGLTARREQRVTSVPAEPGPWLPPPTAPLGFHLRALPPLTIDLGAVVDALRLDDYLDLDESLRAEQITWSVRTLDDTLSALASVRPGRVLQLRGLAAGIDSLVVRARGPRGLSLEDTTAVTVTNRTPEARRLQLLRLPDVAFVAGHGFTAFDLDEYVADRTAHPDSLVRFSASFLGAASMIVQVRADHTVYVIASDSGEALVAFQADDLRLHVSGRDTVRFSAAPPRFGRLPLAFPEVSMSSGGRDSLALDPYLPAQVPATDTAWSVSGQRLVLPAIDPAPPHRLRLAAPDAVGIDTLALKVDLGRGFGGRGTLRVKVTEAVVPGDFRVLLVPNPVAPEHVTVYVLSRRQVASMPAVTRTLAGSGAVAIPVQTTTSDLTGKGVLVWSGTATLPRQLAGTFTVRATAISARGTALSAAASLAYGAARRALPLDLRLDEVSLRLPAGAVPEGVVVAMVSGPDGALPALEPHSVAGPLYHESSVSIYPTGLGLARSGLLRAGGPPRPGRGLYRWAGGGRWDYLGEAPGPVPVTELGFYGVHLDTLPPWVEDSVEAGPGRYRAAVVDEGSGVDRRTIAVRTGESVLRVRWLGDEAFEWELPVGLAAGVVAVTVQVADRAGNTAARTLLVTAPGPPTSPALEAPYPNPFNPATRLAFTVGTTTTVRLGVYNAMGQRVRRLLEDEVTAGRYAVWWDGRDDAGRVLASGAYFVRLQAGDLVLLGRVALVR